MYALWHMHPHVCTTMHTHIEIKILKHNSIILKLIRELEGWLSGQDNLRFGPQHPQGNSQLSVTAVPGDSLSLVTSMGTSCTWCTDTHAGKAPVHIIK